MKRINATRESTKLSKEKGSSSRNEEKSTVTHNSTNYYDKQHSTTDEMNSQSTKKRECYRCHSSEHIARNCPEKKKERCFNCQLIGNVAKDCRKPKSMSRADVKIIENNKETNSNKKYEKTVVVGEKR